MAPKRGGKRPSKKKTARKRAPATAKKTAKKGAPAPEWAGEPFTVIGAGTMGHGIAQAAAMAGYEVRLYDVSEAALDAALAKIRSNLNQGVKLGKVESADAKAALGRITALGLLEEAVRDADFIVEAAPEDLELKRDLFRRLDRVARPGAILASNTSSIRIARIADATEHPGRLLGLHFFNPAYLMALVEVVRGPKTSQYALERAVQVARRLGKTPIVVEDTPGFASTRLGVLIGLEAMRMVEEGVAKPADIDAAMELGYRHPMGPLKLTDLIGLDVRLAIAEYLHRELGLEQYRPPEILRRLVGQGKLGKKSGEGFYRWSEED